MQLRTVNIGFPMSWQVRRLLIIPGAFNNHLPEFPNELHIINGVVEAIQITLQIIFIVNLKQKVRSFKCL